MDKVPVKVVLDSIDARLPVYSKDGDAGADICACENKVIWSGRTCVVNTGLRVEIPPGWEIQVRSRSGLAAKHDVFVLNSPGTIDSGYRGLIKVILRNTGSETFKINIGDRVAQLVLKRAPQAQFVEVKELSDSERGTGGLGSTGVSSG